MSVTMFSQIVLINNGQQKIISEETLEILPSEEFDVSYESYLAEDGVVPKTSSFKAIRISFLLAYLKGIDKDATVHIVASDGYSQIIPYELCITDSALGSPYLAYSKNGEKEYCFTFKPEDGLVTNAEMFSVLGEEYSKYRKGIPSASGMMVKGISHIIINWDGNMDILNEKSDKVSENSEKANENSEFSVNFKGLNDFCIDMTIIDKLDSGKTHAKKIEIEEKGQLNSYAGMQLKEIIAAVDGGRRDHPFDFDEKLWNSGYDITMTAADGYSVTFSTKDVDQDDLYFVWNRNSEKITPMITGNVSGKLKIKNIKNVELSIANQEFTEQEIIISLKSDSKSLDINIHELEKSEYYFEEIGQFTTSAGTVHRDSYAGIDMAVWLKNEMDLKKEDTVQIKASDGYNMSFSGKDILVPENGKWMLAFKLNDEYLPEDPGYFRTIKVGKDVDTEGHNSVKMIVEIEIIKSEYRSYNIEFEGKMNFSIDRDTMQSGINCHKTVVECESKGERNEYEGIALWRLLAYSDDSKYAPHKQDSSIISYDEHAAEKGYDVTIVASDGYSITLKSEELNKNDDVILAVYKNGKELEDKYWPALIAWNSDSENIPENIKMVRNISKIILTER